MDGHRDAAHAGSPGHGRAVHAGDSPAGAKSRADDARVREDIARLPELLDRVDKLIADGTIGTAEPNAADFQILASVAVLQAFTDLGSRCRAGRARRRAAPVSGP